MSIEPSNSAAGQHDRFGLHEHGHTCARLDSDGTAASPSIAEEADHAQAFEIDLLLPREHLTQDLLRPRSQHHARHIATPWVPGAG